MVQVTWLGPVVALGLGPATQPGEQTAARRGHWVAWLETPPVQLGSAAGRGCIWAATLETPCPWPVSLGQEAGFNYSILVSRASPSCVRVAAPTLPSACGLHTGGAPPAPCPPGYPHRPARSQGSQEALPDTGPVHPGAEAQPVGFQ